MAVENAAAGKYIQLHRDYFENEARKGTRKEVVLPSNRSTLLRRLQGSIRKEKTKGPV